MGGKCEEERNLFKEKVIHGESSGDNVMEDSSPTKKPKKEDFPCESSVSGQSSNDVKEPLNIKIEVIKKALKPKHEMKNYLSWEEPLKLTKDLDDSWMDEVGWDNVMMPWNKCERKSNYNSFWQDHIDEQLCSEPHEWNTEH